MGKFCDLCTRGFTQKREQGWPQRYCSVECRSRAKNNRAKFGLEPDGFRRLLVEQDFTCAMPRCQSPVGVFRSHIDHDHQTGAVRGVLCPPCNVGLGHLEKLFSLGADEYLKGGGSS